MNERLLVWVISGAAIAFIVGFLIGGAVFKTDTDSYTTTIAELEVQLSDLHKSTQAEVQNAKAGKLALQKQYDSLSSNFKEAKANYLALQKEHSTISSESKNEHNSIAKNLQEIATTQKTEKRAEEKSILLPKYSVLDEKAHDAPVKAQIELHILVTDNITENGLRQLLTKLYSSSIQKTKFKYHDSPTNVFIYAYKSKAHYNSGMGLWIKTQTASLCLGQTTGDLF